MLWIVGWAVAMVVLSIIATAIVGMLGRMVVPRSTGSLHLLAAAIGITLLIAGIVNLVVSLLSETTFAAILFTLYRHLGRDNSVHHRNHTSQLLQQTPTESNSPPGACSHGAQSVRLSRSSSGR